VRTVTNVSAVFSAQFKPKEEAVMSWKILLAPLVSLLFTASAFAQDTYPKRAIHLIVGLAAGSSTDVTARIVGQKMGQAFGQTIVVENRPGAAGNVATGFVARAPADGYTLLFGSAATTVNATLLPNAGFDLVKDLTPIALLASVPNILVVHPSLGVKSLKDLIAKARSRPNEIIYASSGIGSSPHLSAELFSMMAGVKLVHVPYKGSSQAITDLIAGRTSLMFAPAPTALPYLKSNTLIALGSTQLKRASAAPNLPTMDELGLKGFDTGVWFGLFAPAGTPKAIVDQLARAANEAIQSDEVRAAFAPLGIDGIGSTPDEFSSYVRTEIDKWAKVVDAAGLKP
jgi:tripartite-type tricarboxylate transporter receptor subunit TctC